MGLVRWPARWTEPGITRAAGPEDAPAGTRPAPSLATHLSAACAGASAWAASDAGVDAEGAAGTTPGAGNLGGEPSSSTSATALPMVNQSFIWSTVSLRSMLAARPVRRELPKGDRDLTARGEEDEDAPRPAPNPPIRARQRPWPRSRAAGSALAR